MKYIWNSEQVQVRTDLYFMIVYSSEQLCSMPNAWFFCAVLYLLLMVTMKWKYVRLHSAWFSLWYLDLTLENKDLLIKWEKINTQHMPEVCQIAFCISEFCGALCCKLQVYRQEFCLIITFGWILETLVDFWRKILWPRVYYFRRVSAVQKREFTLEEFAIRSSVYH